MATQTAVMQQETIDLPNAAGPNPGDVIVTSNLWKTYEMGDQKVNALRGVTCASSTMSTSRSWVRQARESRP